MADPNALPNKESEDLDTRIKTRMNEIREKLEASGIQERVKEKMAIISEKYNPDVLSKENRKYVNTLPSDYKNKALRYLDIFRENPEVVSEYLTTLKQFGNEKDAKEAGATNILFYPSKILAHLSKNPEQFSEETLKRQTAFDLQGGSIYDIAYREDEIGKKKQK